jgi:F-type H+-transporting ATPase subunit delta
MAELATIARPYAEALFKATQADLTGTSEWLNAVAAVANDAQLQAFVGNPNTQPEQVYDLLVGVAKVVLSDKGGNFVRTVIDNGRVNVLPEIAQQFQALKNKASGTDDVMIYSAFALDDSAVADVKSLLEKRFGRPLNATVTVDPELIGGIRAVVGDEVLDTSVKARLEQMKVALSA